MQYGGQKLLKKDMKIDIEIVPKKGDYEAFKAVVWHDGQLQFTVIGKLTGTELASSIAKECVKTPKEAYEGLKQFTLQEAKRIFNSKDYKTGSNKEIFYSPCWTL